MNKLNGKITKSATMRGALTRGAGGGTYVEANPEGEAIDILEKLMVESDIFEIRNVPETTGAELGSVLTRTASGAGWFPVPKELPPVASGDNGDVLKLVNGAPVWSRVVNYSTNEHIIGTWIDGVTPVYEKTYYIQNLINDGEIHYFDDLTADKIISLTGSVERVIPNLGIIQCIINTYEGQNYKNVVRYDKYINKMGYLVFYYPGGGESAQNLVVTVRYTKVGE